MTINRFWICWRSNGGNIATHVKRKIALNKLIYNWLLKKLQGKLRLRNKQAIGLIKKTGVFGLGKWLKGMT